jgi:hypothetical protein
MIKMIFAFFVVFLMFYFGIKVFNNLSMKEKFSLTKVVAYATMCSVLAIAALSVFVFIF